MKSTGEAVLSLLKRIFAVLNKKLKQIKKGENVRVKKGASTFSQSYVYNAYTGGLLKHFQDSKYFCTHAAWS